MHWIYYNSYTPLQFWILADMPHFRVLCDNISAYTRTLTKHLLYWLSALAYKWRFDIVISHDNTHSWLWTYGTLRYRFVLNTVISQTSLIISLIIVQVMRPSIMRFISQRAAIPHIQYLFIYLFEHIYTGYKHNLARLLYVVLLYNKTMWWRTSKTSICTIYGCQLDKLIGVSLAAKLHN